jgi:uncharacterized membrane protein YdjX (TVP38/TMEM64 family)
MPQHHRFQRNHRQSLRRWLALALLAFIGVLALTPARDLLSETVLQHHIQAVGPYGGLLFVLVFSLVTSLGFPGNVMTIIGGTLFGFVWGSIWSVLGATLGAIGAFLLGRSLLHDWVEARFGHHPILRQIQQAIKNRPFHFVLLSRFTPLSPFSLINFLFGLTAINLRTYSLATFLGIIPSTIAYAWIGVSGKMALTTSNRFSLFCALGFLTLLAIVPMCFKKRPVNQSEKAVVLPPR